MATVTEPVPQIDRYTDPKGAAEIMCLSVGTVYNLMSAGKLKAVKIGRSRRIAIRDIMELMKTGVESIESAA